MRFHRVPCIQIKHESDNLGLKFTLYQYQTCPFCCKTTVLLDFTASPINMVKVTSVRRNEVK